MGLSLVVCGKGGRGTGKKEHRRRGTGKKRHMFVLEVEKGGTIYFINSNSLISHKIIEIFLLNVHSTKCMH